MPLPRVFHLAFLLGFSVSPALAVEYVPNSGTSGGFFSRESKRFGLSYSNFSGDRNKSLTGASAFGVEAGIARGNRFLQVFTKLRVDHSSGQADFLDATAALRLDYRLFAAGAALGLRVYPVTSADGGLGIYFGAAGAFGMAQLKLPDRAYTELQSSRSSTTLGYDLVAGVEFGGRVYLEAALRTARAKLGGEESFALDALVLQGGFQW